MRLYTSNRGFSARWKSPLRPVELDNQRLISWLNDNEIRDLGDFSWSSYHKVNWIVCAYKKLCYVSCLAVLSILVETFSWLDEANFELWFKIVILNSMVEQMYINQLLSSFEQFQHIAEECANKSSRCYLDRSSSKSLWCCFLNEWSADWCWRKVLHTVSSLWHTWFWPVSSVASLLSSVPLM